MARREISPLESGQNRAWQRVGRILGWLVLIALGVQLLGWLALRLIMAAWSRSESTPRTYAVALGDLNGDGRLDAFYGNGLINAPHASIVMFQQPGQPGTFRDSGQTLGDGMSREVRLADLDADGDLDAMATGLPNYSFFFNQGDGSFSADTRWSSGVLGKWSLESGDLDRDGDLDLLASGCCVSGDLFNYVLINQGGSQGGEIGVFRSGSQMLESQDAQAAALGDLDVDGDLDVFFGNDFASGPSGEILPGQPNTVWWNDGAGRFSDSGQRLGEVQTKGVALGDLDGDEDLDAAVITREVQRFCFFSGCTRLAIWVNAGDGSFTLSPQRLSHRKALAYDLGDLDGDGDLDIFAGWYKDGYLVWWNDGEGNFSP